MKQPLVSVIIPFYSGYGWLKAALKSVENQTYKDFEVLVINDGSNEDIKKLISMFDMNLTIINKENGGPASARNLGIEKSVGKYIAFLDSDDLWLSSKLTHQVNFMEKNKFVWSQHSYKMFWENSDKTKTIFTNHYSGNVYKDCFISFKIQTSCVMVLREVLMEKNIRFPLEKRYGQDGHFYRQLARYYPLGYFDGVFSEFRIRGSNAGFRARVQLNDRTSIWNEIKKDNSALGILPKEIIFAYILTSKLSRIVEFTSRVIHNDEFLEIISKILYILPYTIFKFETLRG